MSEIIVYAFETEGDESATEWTTMSYPEASDYAKQHGYSLIARTFEYADSELVEDYRPGHNLDGTLTDEGAAEAGDPEALYSVGVTDGQAGLPKRHDSAQYDLGYSIGVNQRVAARDGF